VHNIDLIVPLSYATLPDRLTNGSRESLLKALHYKKMFPNAVFILSNPAHSGFTECDLREYELKKKLLADTPHMCAYASTNSIMEAEAIKTATQFAPKRILVICGEAHSRGTRLIWQKVFPDATILIRCIPYSYEHQGDHPFMIERYAWAWFLASIARHVLLLALGLRIRNMQHRAN
jgi:hypothetical protein